MCRKVYAPFFIHSFFCLFAEFDPQMRFPCPSGGINAGKKRAVLNEKLKKTSICGVAEWRCTKYARSCETPPSSDTLICVLFLFPSVCHNTYLKESRQTFMPFPSSILRVLFCLAFPPPHSFLERACVPSEASHLLSVFSLQCPPRSIFFVPASL